MPHCPSNRWTEQVWLEGSYALSLAWEPQWIRSFSKLISTVTKLHDCPRHWNMASVGHDTYMRKKKNCWVLEPYLWNNLTLLEWMPAIHQTGAASWACLTGLRQEWVTQRERPQQQSMCKAESRHTVYLKYKSNPQPWKKQLFKSWFDYIVYYTDKWVKLKVGVTLNKEERTRVNTWVIVCKKLCHIQRN